MEPNPLRTVGHGLLLIAAMLALIAAALWFRSGPLEPAALGRGIAISTENTGVPDSGQQRQQMIQQLESLNGCLKRIEDGLRGGTFVIQTAEPGKAAPQAPEK